MAEVEVIPKHPQWMGKQNREVKRPRQLDGSFCLNLRALQSWLKNSGFCSVPPFPSTPAPQHEHAPLWRDTNYCQDNSK